MLLFEVFQCYSVLCAAPHPSLPVWLVLARCRVIPNGECASSFPQHTSLADVPNRFSVTKDIRSRLSCWFGRSFASRRESAPRQELWAGRVSTYARHDTLGGLHATFLAAISDRRCELLCHG